jgi:hypothetical protein
MRALFPQFGHRWQVVWGFPIRVRLAGRLNRSRRGRDVHFLPIAACDCSLRQLMRASRESVALRIYRASRHFRAEPCAQHRRRVVW